MCRTGPQGIVDELIQRRQKIIQPRRDARLGIYFPIGLDAQMQVGKMEDFHPLTLFPSPLQRGGGSFYLRGASPLLDSPMLDM